MFTVHNESYMDTAFPAVCPEDAVAVETDVHTDEWTSDRGYDLYALLARRRPANIWAVRANERTWRTNRLTGQRKRYTDRNLQTASASAAIDPSAYEVLRDRELAVAVAAARCVIQTHAHIGTVDYAWYNKGAPDYVRGIVSAFGIDRAVHVKPPNMKYDHPTHMTVDFGVLRKPRYLGDMYDVLEALGNGTELKPEAIQEYTFLADVTVEQSRAIGLPDEHTAWEPFSAADQERLVEHGFPAATVPTCWSYEQYGSRNGYIGELALPITSV